MVPGHWAVFHRVGLTGALLCVENILRWTEYFQPGAMSFLKRTAATPSSAHYQFHFLKFTPSHLLPLLPLPNNNKQKKRKEKKKTFKYIWGKHCSEITQESFRKPPIWKSSPTLGAKSEVERGRHTHRISSQSLPTAPSSQIMRQGVHWFGSSCSLGLFPSHGVSPLPLEIWISTQIIHNEALILTACEAHCAFFICICILTRSKGVILDLWKIGH